MNRNNLIKINILVIMAIIAILNFLTLKIIGVDVPQKRMAAVFSIDKNHSNPAEVAGENRWNVTPSELPINGLITKPICYWLKIRI